MTGFDDAKDIREAIMGMEKAGEVLNFLKEKTAAFQGDDTWKVMEGFQLTNLRDLEVFESDYIDEVVEGSFLE